MKDFHVFKAVFFRVDCIVVQTTQFYKPVFLLSVSDEALGSGGQISFKPIGWRCTNYCKKMPCQVANFLLLSVFDIFNLDARLIFSLTSTTVGWTLLWALGHAWWPRNKNTTPGTQETPAWCNLIKSGLEVKPAHFHGCAWYTTLPE